MKEKKRSDRDFDLLAKELNERTRRLLAASEAIVIGRGGIAIVSRATGLSCKAISLGIKQLHEEASISPGRIRREGGGRKKTVTKDVSLSEDLERLVEPVTRGDPESPLRWTCKSVRKLAMELNRQGHQISHQLVSELLHDLGYSLQANRKTREGGEHPDRNAQFEQVNAQTKSFLAQGEPVISVDAKKKELVGDFKNPGREWHPEGEAQEVRVYDFPIAGLGSSHPLRDLRLGEQHGLGQCGHRPRYGGLCGRKHPPVVDAGGQAKVPRSEAVAHQCGWRRQ